MKQKNGYRNIVTLRSFKTLSPGGKLFCFGLVVLALAFVIGSAMGVFAVGTGAKVVAAKLVTPLFKFNKDGLTGDNLKLMEDLEKRMSLELKEDSSEAEIIAIFQKHMTAKLEERMTAVFKDIDQVKLKEFLGEDEKGIRSILVKQGEAIAQLKAKGGAEAKDLSIRGQILAWKDKNKDAISKVMAKESKELPALEIRVASPMTPANTLNASAYLPRPEFEAGIHDIRRVQPTFWDYVPKGRTSQAAYVWVNKQNPLGVAAYIGPGVAKPGISFELNTEISNAKKIAVSDKIATELLDDIDGMESYVRDEMTYQLNAKTNTTLMTGVLSSTVPAGIQTISQLFATGGLSCSNPTNQDCIRSLVAQLRVNFIPGPITIFTNPIDAANMDMNKATTSGVYLIPPFQTADGRTIAGCTVVEDVNVAVGFVQAAVLDLFKVKIYKDFILSFGWENDDFTKNLVTAIAERRIHVYHSNNDAQAFIYDSFANIKTAIALP